MATLVLTAAGALLGPVGGAVGALIGQAIDGRIFGTGNRQGPRLQDLKVQTSSYGAAIPKLFGTMRVAGTVIWSTDLIEHRARQGGGKGRPSSTTYSYSASFAVLLSGRAIRSVGRIWADGNLLRGAAGDWKSETGFRLHLGDEDQAADPFIASAEGATETPAYRGYAYAVFENMALEVFGNRIPSLTFEVEADADAVGVGTMLDELSDGALGGATGPALSGFAASGDSVRSLVETLGQALPLALRDDGEALQIVQVSDVVTAIGPDEIGDETSETLPAAGRVPGALTISYYEPARDYQAGAQAARRPTGSKLVRIELPAAIEAGQARQLAEEALARAAREQGQRTIRCGWKRLGMAPGALVQLPDSASIWRVADRSVDREGVRLDLRRMRGASLAAPAAEPGRHVTAPDQVHGPTVAHLLDLPNLADSAAAAPRLLVVAAGVSPGWRRASLMISLDQGASWASIGATAPPAVIGAALTALPRAPAALIDRAHNVEIQLLHSEMELHDADETRLLAGANLALLGDELIQFGRAEPIGGAHWRLSNLVRGRRGTERAAGSHAAGERFVLIEAETLLPYDPPPEAIGSEVRLLVSGLGDAEPVETSAGAIGEALRPPPPVHFAARRRADGGLDLSWVRSSRVGWAWLDGADAPLGESGELYRLTMTRGDGGVRSHELAAAEFHYAVMDLAADLDAGNVQLSVAQIGGGVESRPAELTLIA